MKNVGTIQLILSILAVVSCRGNETMELRVSTNVEDVGITNARFIFSDSSQENVLITVDDLENLFSNDCSYMHTNNLRYSLNVNDDGAYVEYRRAECIADFYLALLESENPLVLYDTVEIGSHVVNKNNGVPGGWLIDIFDKENVEELQISPINGIYNREQIITRIANHYLEAIKYAFEISLDNENRLEVYYYRLKDIYLEEEELERVVGSSLLSQMFASLPNYIRKISDLKKEIANDAIKEGVRINNEWGGDLSGRTEAFKNLLGTVDVGTQLPWEDMEFSFLPKNVDSLPTMTNELSKAISLLSKYNADITNYNGTDQDYEYFKLLLLDNINQERRELSMRLYDDDELDAFCNENGISEQDIENAYKYMYVHMFFFPRLPTLDENDDLIVEWSSPFVSSPVSYLMRDFAFYPAHMIGTGVSHKGLQPIIGSILNDIKLNNTVSPFVKIQDFTQLDQYSVTTPEEAEYTENLIWGLLQDIKRDVTNILGQKEIVYKISRSSGSIWTDYIKINNPSVSADSEFLDKLRLYPIDDDNDVRDVRQQRNIACSILDNGELPTCADFRNSVVEIALESCTEEPENLCGGYNRDISGYDYWIIDGAVTNSDENIQWKPVGIINTKTDSSLYWITLNNGTMTATGMLYPDSEILKMASKVASIDPYSIDRPSCDPINGLNKECILSDWVPTIDNELIDPVGNQYEQSYRHYIESARISIDKAKQIGEGLFNNIVQEAGDRNMEDAQLDNAIEQYVSEMTEICGDLVNHSEIRDAVVNAKFALEDILTNSDTTDDDTTFEMLLREEINNLYVDTRYGCKYRTNGSLTNEENEGPALCAVKRNCDTKNAYNLGNLGIFAGDYSPDIAPSSRLLSTEQCENTNIGIPDLMNPRTFLYNSMNTFTDYEDLVPLIDNLLCWQNKYRYFVTWALKNESIYYLPELILQNGPQDIIYNRIQDLRNIRGLPNYGQYYNKMIELINVFEDTKSSAENYISGLDTLGIMTEKYRTAINRIKNQGELNTSELESTTWNITLQFQQLLAQSEAYDLSLEQPTQNCLNSVEHLFYTNGGTVVDFTRSLRELNKSFISNAGRSYETIDTSKNGFAVNCKDAASRSGNQLLLNYGHEICNKLSENNFMEATYLQGNSRPPAYWTNSDTHSIWFRQYANPYSNDYRYLMAFGPIDIWSHNDIDEYLNWGQEADEKVVLNCFSNTTRKAGVLKNHCDENSHTTDMECYPMLNIGKTWDISDFCIDNGTVWYQILGTEQISQTIHEYIRNIELEKCKTSYGCDVSDSNVVESCTGTGVYKGIVDEAERINDMSQELKESSLELIALNTLLDQETETQDFVADYLNKIQKINEFRRDLSNNVRLINVKVSELGMLEEMQITNFSNLTNGWNIAKASSKSSITAWNDRYNYRKQNYKNQLERAKIAAWIARRAIEFRFGIDLSRENIRTIHGDTPYEWADDIYYMSMERCEEILSSEIDEGTSIEDCLSYEDKLEQYVTKLEDYVESYGNSPEQEWWIHEDDDVGIISLKNDFALGNRIAKEEVDNLLFFTEEMDMEDADIDSQYYEVLDDLQEYYVTPSGWSTIGDVEINSNENMQNRLGLYKEVSESHYNNETGIFADQEEEQTADLVGFAENSILTQTINKEEALSDVGQIDELNFSVFLRDAPQEQECNEAEGEKYIPILGQCRLTCEAASQSGIQGSCPYDGQVCYQIDARYDENLVEEDYVRICDWCTADRTCIGQDGTVVGIGLNYVKHTDYKMATKNVEVKKGWKRKDVDTVENLHDDTVIAPRYDDIDVMVYSTQTQNFTRSSEIVDLSNGWELHQPANIENVSTESPDMVERSTKIELNRQSDTTYGKLSVEAELPLEYEGWITASIWMKVDEMNEADEIKLSMEIKSEESSNETTIGYESVKLQKQGWYRYSVKGRKEENISTVKLYISPDIQDPDNVYSNYAIDIWGAQIEKGDEPTVYLPTGKNLIVSSDDLLEVSTWMRGVGINVEKNDVIIAPNERIGQQSGAFLLTDNENDSSNDEYIEQVVMKEINRDLTLSLWMQSENVPVGTVIRTYWSENESMYEEFEITDMGEDWKRYAVVLGTENAEARNYEYCKIRIYPSVGEYQTGEISVWGIQLEYGDTATGYQETDNSILDNIRIWTPRVGVSGAQLTKIQEYPCDELGKSVLEDDGCEERYENIRHECCNNIHDWDNDGEYEDYGTYLEVCMTCNMDDNMCSAAMMNCYPPLLCQSREEEDTGYSCAGEPHEYRRNTYLRRHVESGFEIERMVDADYPMLFELATYMDEETKERIFKNKFRYVQSNNGEPGYYEYQFTIGMDEGNELISQKYGTIAQNNFNYRNRTIAMNVVGTDVINCSFSDNPVICASNNWISYDMKQWGDVKIKNHHEEETVRRFIIPDGIVNGGKAIVAEQVVGYPISSAHQNMISQVNKISLMGRPIQGLYEIRLYDTGGLVWDNMEDIQIILGYHYWTRSE